MHLEYDATDVPTHTCQNDDQFCSVLHNRQRDFLRIKSRALCISFSDTCTLAKLLISILLRTNYGQKTITPNVFKQKSFMFHFCIIVF